MHLDEVEPVRRVIPLGGEANATAADGDEGARSLVNPLGDGPDKRAQRRSRQRPLQPPKAGGGVARSIGRQAARHPVGLVDDVERVNRVAEGLLLSAGAVAFEQRIDQGFDHLATSERRRERDRAAS